MIFHRALGDPERVRDLLVGQPLRREPQDIHPFGREPARRRRCGRHVEDLMPLEELAERLGQRARAALLRQARQTPQVAHPGGQLSRGRRAQKPTRNSWKSFANCLENGHPVFVVQAVVDEAEIDAGVGLERGDRGRSIGDVGDVEGGDRVEERATETLAVQRVVVDEEERERHGDDSTGTKIVLHPYLRTDGKAFGRSYGGFVTYDRARSLRLSLVDGTRSSLAEAPPAPSDRISDVHSLAAPATSTPALPSGVALGAELASALAMLRPRRSIEGYTATGHALVASALEARFGFVAIACPDTTGGASRQGQPCANEHGVVRVLYALGHKQVDAPTVLTALHATPSSGVHPMPVRRLQASCLLASGVEVFFVFERMIEEQPFSAAEARRLEALQPALRPFAERVALGHGAGTGRALLTRREREAAAMLLGARAQKCFSDELGTSDARAREVVRNVYTKLGVSSRSELCAAWLGGEGANDELTCLEVTLQRPRPPR